MTMLVRAFTADESSHSAIVATGRAVNVGAAMNTASRVFALIHCRAFHPPVQQAATAAAPKAQVVVAPDPLAPLLGVLSKLAEMVIGAVIFIGFVAALVKQFSRSPALRTPRSAPTHLKGACTLKAPPPPAAQTPERKR